jgi:hypothetical protein
MTAWARAGRTIASPSRLARSAPPLRGCGLDRLSPARRGLAKRLWLKVSASAPFVTDLPGRKRVLRDRDRPFARLPRDAMLSGCPDRAPAWALCPTIFTSDWSLGPTSAGRPTTALRPGPSRTIGPSMCQSPTPNSTCSRHGSAISSMNCSGRADDLTGRYLP